MQYIQAIMANLNVIRNFLSDGESKATRELFKKTEESISNKKPIDAGSGDFDYENMSSIASTVDSCITSSASKYNYYENPPERSLHKQLHNTKTLVTTLENEIAESKEDVHYLHNQIYSAEEIFPKRWETCKHLQNTCKQQVETMGNEMLKWKRKIERFDIEVKELEQRIGSWQCLIDRAKEAQVQETDFFE